MGAGRGPCHGSHLCEVGSDTLSEEGARAGGGEKWGAAPWQSVRGGGREVKDLRSS